MSGTQRNGSEPRWISLAGQVDIARRDELRACLAAAADGDRDVVLDVSQVTFMDSTGLSLIATLAGELQPSRHRVAIVGASPSVERLIRLAGLDAVTDLGPG